MAKAHLDAELAASGGAGPAVDAFFPFSQADNYALANVGQLKNIAAAFYDRLDEVCYEAWDVLVANGFPAGELSSAPPVYPWNPNAPASENDAPVNIGQLKMVFSFDLAGFTPCPWDNLPEYKILASDGAAGDFFGVSADLFGDDLIAGAIGKVQPSGLSLAGQAYLFEGFNGTGWTTESTLKASDPSGSDYFGWSVAMDGDWAAAGAMFEDDAASDSGAVYLYKKDPLGNWPATETQKIKASAPWLNGHFGFSVEISGNYLIVGADNQFSEGRAYVFEENAGVWTETAILDHADVTANDAFGESVGISGGVAVAGAYMDDPNAVTDAGAAYVFRYDGTQWASEAKLIHPTPGAFDNFGNSVAVSGDVIAVGAPFDDDGGVNSGSVVLYRFDPSSQVWQWEQTLLASDSNVAQYFGFSVSLQGDTLVVGSYGDDDAGSESGSAYIFRYNSTSGAWEELAKLTASDAALGDYYGYGVAAGPNLAVAGAPFDADLGSASGSAYAYPLPVAASPPFLDTDLDDISDGWEQQLIDAEPAFNSIFDVAPGDDWDNDGLTNLAEYYLSLDPTTPAVQDNGSAAVNLETCTPLP